MSSYPLPPDEHDRLAALRALLILDTPPEERFDRITSFAATEFAAPIAAISLVDADRLWFKSKTGLTICEAERDTSFCTHGISSTDLMVIDDLRLDPRFADNPYVIGEAAIRFYAGAPLVLQSGQIAGMFCIMDSCPRTFDAVDRAILTSLRDLAAAELEPATGPLPSTGDASC